MDPSPVLRLQSQNKVRSDCLRMKNENNKMPAQPKPSKPQSVPHFSAQNIENQDPENSQMGRKAPVRPGVSRLPVLAKSLHLQTPSDFSQSHCRWEEKPLSGKAKKKKPCTRPIPFNFSQPKSSRVVSENQQPPTLPQTRTGTQAVQPDNNARNVPLKAQNITGSKPIKLPATLNSIVDSSKGTGKLNGKATENTSKLSGQSVSSITFKTSSTLSQPRSAVSNNALHQNHSGTSSAQSILNTEACLKNMNQLSLKDPTKSSQASQNMPLTTQGNFSNNSAEKVENFKPDHAALLSILRNEGVSATGFGSATPQSQPYNYVPQRVSIMKSRQKLGAPTGSVKSLQFSPDPAALQSILQNEGIKAVGATPRNPVRPSGRGTSVYTAQRVPVKKNHNEANGGPVAAVLKETPLKKWTPQRVRDTRHQPMSAVKWHLSTQQSPYGSTPGLRSLKTSLQPHQEEIVQRLFYGKEDQQCLNVAENDPETQEEQLSVKIKTEESDLKNKPLSEEKIDISRTSEDKEEDEQKLQELGVLGRQPFFQAPQRESVIFFSTGKKLLRAPRFEKQETSVLQEQHSLVSSAQSKKLPVHEEKPFVSVTAHQNIPAVQSLQRDLVVQKACSKSPAVALLRKRLPQLEELRLDEEVATYTSLAIQAALGSLPPRPRCGNPVASILHFDELSRFVPIGCGPSSSPQSSPLYER